MTNKKKIVWEYAKAIITALILAMLIRTFIIQAFKIPSGSMIPTLLVGDHILVNKFLYGTKIPFSGKRVLMFKKPERGDIIVFKYPENPSKDFIKRVVAIEGDVIESKNNGIFRNKVKRNNICGFKFLDNPKIKERIAPRIIKRYNPKHLEHKDIYLPLILKHLPGF